MRENSKTSANNEYKSYPHIRACPANTKGKDYIIGDVHGSSLTLQQVLEQLSVNDRLFIVGDLFDRGDDSVGVFDLIQRSLNNKSGPLILCVRGNHEELFLQAMRYYLDGDLNYFDKYSLLTEDNGGGWIHDAEEDTLRRIRKYLSSLPYVIRTEGSDDVDPFIVCHADCPLDDKEIEGIISNGDKLTSEEIDHITWARDEEIDRCNNRTKNSIRTYCGHNIIRGRRTSVRRETNHVNLDAGASHYGQLLGVNHTDSTVFVTGTVKRKRPSVIKNICILKEYLHDSLEQKKREKLERLEKQRIVSSQMEELIVDDVKPTADEIKKVVSQPVISDIIEVLLEAKLQLTQRQVSAIIKHGSIQKSILYFVRFNIVITEHLLSAIIADKELKALLCKLYDLELHVNFDIIKSKRIIIDKIITYFERCEIVSTSKFLDIIFSGGDQLENILLLLINSNIVVPACKINEILENRKINIILLYFSLNNLKIESERQLNIITANACIQDALLSLVNVGEEISSKRLKNITNDRRLLKTLSLLRANNIEINTAQLNTIIENGKLLCVLCFLFDNDITINYDQLTLIVDSEILQKALGCIQNFLLSFHWNKHSGKKLASIRCFTLDACHLLLDNIGQSSKVSRISSRFFKGLSVIAKKHFKKDKGVIRAIADMICLPLEIFVSLGVSIYRKRPSWCSFFSNAKTARENKAKELIVEPLNLESSDNPRR